MGIRLGTVFNLLQRTRRRGRRKKREEKPETKKEEHGFSGVVARITTQHHHHPMQPRLVPLPYCMGTHCNSMKSKGGCQGPAVHVPTIVANYPYM
jgi:hypothetical protein